MQEPTFAILTSLASGPRHGYAIMADVLDVTDGAIRLQAGTLYGALERLRCRGHVQVAGEEVVSGRLRRSYTLTPTGTELLRAEAARRRAAADRALGRLAASGKAAVAR
jgi:DNA-binding PadR family transcriptional regulator